MATHCRPRPGTRPRAGRALRHRCSCRGRGPLVSEQARAHGRSEVLKALDRAAVGLRTKLGESLASVKQFSRAFEELATASLDALKAYTIGRNEWLNHGEAVA